LQIAKVHLDLIEGPPGALALRRQQTAALPQAALGSSRHGTEDVQVGDQCVRRGRVGSHPGLWRLVRDAQHEQRVGEHQLARGLGARDVDVIDVRLSGAEPMRRDRLDEAPAVGRVGARQRHEVLHRRVRDDVALPDVLLHGIGQRAHQTQAPRHPAHAPIETARDHVERQPVLLMERAQQPRLLEHVLGRVRLQQMAKDQRLARAQLPDHRRDDVAMQTAQAADAFVAIYHNVLGLEGHDHDGHLLTDIGDQRQQPPLAGRLAHTERVVGRSRW
jgi:hypothetical protein